MKRILLIAFATVVVFTLASAAWYYSRFAGGNTYKAPVAGVKLKRLLKDHARELLPFAKNNNYNTSVCFIVNMNIASGSKRFFVYDLQKDSAIDAGLVTHGHCNGSGKKYDNKIGCGCTSLGKYRIGKSYQGQFGLAYKLHGLDSTNSNAYKRYVVLHSHECVPNEPIDPFTLCRSEGCPTVSPAFLKSLATIINASPKPILLCIVGDQ